MDWMWSRNERERQGRGPNNELMELAAGRDGKIGRELPRTRGSAQHAYRAVTPGSRRLRQALGSLHPTEEAPRLRQEPAPCTVDSPSAHMGWGPRVSPPLPTSPAGPSLRPPQHLLEVTGSSSLYSSLPRTTLGRQQRGRWGRSTLALDPSNL